IEPEFLEQSEEIRTQEVSRRSADDNSPGQSRRLELAENSAHNLTTLNSRARRAPGRRRHLPPSKLKSMLSETFGSSTRTRYSLLQIIHAAQPVSRVELARRLGIKRSRVSEIINPMLAAGVCRETSFEQVSGRLGRPPVGLSLCAERV